MRAVVVRSTVYAPEGNYVEALEFTFNALEYLKGSGGATVRGIAIGANNSTADTADEAAALARQELDRQDTGWDDRQAIVTLLSTDDGYLLMGYIDEIMVGQWYPKWLPDAAPGSDSTSGATGQAGPSAEQHFLWDLPDTPGAAGASRASATPTTVSLSTIREKVKAFEEQVTAGGGSEAYRECIYETLSFNRMAARDKYRRRDGAILSGLPAKTRMVWDEASVTAILTHHNYPTTPPDGFVGDRWYEGRDAALFAYEYPAYSVSTRPLPAGEYRAFRMGRNDKMVPCDGDPWGARGKWEEVVTVTAPEGTVAEAFFDPVTDGEAVGAATNVGPIRYEDGSVKAELTPDVTDTVLDFIALDGSVTLSLVADEATSTDDILTWPVDPAPWSAGDLLMLRIRDRAMALSGLSLDGISLDFAPTQTEYIVRVAQEVAETVVRATPGAGGDGVRITVNGDTAEVGAVIPLVVGGNVISVAAVEGGGGVGPLYTVTVTRARPPQDTTAERHRWGITLSPESGVRPADGQTAIDVHVTVDCNGSDLLSVARCPFETGSITFQVQADGSEPGEATHRDDFGGPRKPFVVKHGPQAYTIRLNLRPGSGDAEYVPIVLMQDGVQVVEAPVPNQPSPDPIAGRNGWMVCPVPLRRSRGNTSRHFWLGDL